MKVNLLIEEDDMFRSHVKSLIEGQVRHVLREQLSGIVAGEIAKLRLLQPNSQTLGDLVAAELKKQTSQKVTPSAIATELQRQVKAEVDKAIKPLAQQVKDALSEAIAAKIKAWTTVLSSLPSQYSSVGFSPSLLWLKRAGRPIATLVSSVVVLWSERTMGMYASKLRC